MTSKYLKTIIKTQKTFIKELLDRLAQREEDRCLDLISEKFFMNINGNAYPLEQIKNLLNDLYFKGLTLEQIMELAKKSIRITTYNRQLETALEEIKAELKDDLTCESRECGCDDYGECLECLKETILNIITEVIG